jgi:hypothetical protein
MRADTVPHAAPPPITEGTRVTLRDVAGKPKVIFADSVGMIRPEDTGHIFLTASHAALPGGRPDTLIPRGIYAVFFSDAGVGLDGAGTARLPVLDADGIIAGTTSGASAPIGDSRALYERGVLSHLTSAGVRAGSACHSRRSLICCWQQRPAWNGVRSRLNGCCDRVSMRRITGSANRTIRDRHLVRPCARLATACSLNDELWNASGSRAEARRFSDYETCRHRHITDRQRVGFSTPFGAAQDRIPAGLLSDRNVLNWTPPQRELTENSRTVSRKSYSPSCGRSCSCTRRSRARVFFGAVRPVRSGATASG